MSARLYSPDCPTPTTKWPTLHEPASTPGPFFAHKAIPKRCYAAQAVPFSSPPRDLQQYRRTVFSIFENEFCLGWERQIEPHLIYTSKNKPYYHCLILMKAIRRLLRLEVTNDGTLAWGKPENFTQDESLMTSRAQLFRLCCRIKPSFTFSQYRTAMMLLRRYKLVFCTYGRKPNTKGKGTILFLRLNANYLANALKGAAVQDRGLQPSNLTDGVVTNVLTSSGLESPDREEENKFKEEVKALSVSNREKEIIGLLTETPNLFQSDDRWDQHCVKTNLLTLEQFRNVRRLIRQGVLTVKFVQDYCSFQSLGIGWLVQSDGKKVWWANCDITFFLIRCGRVRSEFYRHQAYEFEAAAMPTPDDAAILEDIKTKTFIYYHVLPDVDRINPSLLEHPAGVPTNPTVHDLRTITEQEATRAIAAVRAFESGQMGDPAYARVMRSAEPHLRRWLQQNPHHAEWCLRTLPSFCKWIDISPEDRWRYRRDAAQIDYAEKARPWLVAQARQRCFWR